MFTILGPFTKIWSLNMETKQGSLDMYGSVGPYGVVNEFGGLNRGGTRLMDFMLF